MKERIAHFADIDTRRAMGYGPRPLVVPDLTRHHTVMNFGQGVHVDFGNGIRLIRCSDMYNWFFPNKVYSFNLQNKVYNVWNTNVGRYEERNYQGI